MDNKDREKLNKELESAQRQIAECKESEAEKIERISDLLHNEKRFNLFIENFPDPVISYSQDGLIQYVNKKTEEITGYSHDELIGKSIIDSILISEHSIPIIEASLKKETHTKTAVLYEIEGLTKSGNTIFFEVSGVPVSVKGKSEIFVIARDITKRKLADRRAQHLESVLQSIKSANVSTSAKKNREIILEKACNQIVRVRKYNNAWAILLDKQNKPFASAQAGIGHEFRNIMSKFTSGKPSKCVKSALERDGVAINDNPLMDCCECPLSMLYYGKKCMSVSFKYNSSYGVIVASAPITIINDTDEHRFLCDVAEYLCSALQKIELDEEASLIEGSLRQSEEKYKAVFEHANEAICIVQDSMLKLCNPRAAEMTGYSNDELHGKPLADLVHPDDIDQVLGGHTKRSKGNKLTRENYFRFVKKSGEIRWAEMNTVAIEWEGNSAMLNFVNDITERKLMEEALCESEERHRALVEASSKAGIGIIILQSTEDQEAVIVFANDGAIQLTGYTKDEILSQPLGEFMPAEEFLVVLERYRNRQKGIPTVSYYETHVISKDGSLVPVLVSAATMKLHGKIATVVFFRDMAHTEKRKKQHPSTLRL